MLEKKVTFMMAILFIIALSTTLISIVVMNFEKDLNEKRNNLMYCAEMVSLAVQYPDEKVSVVTESGVKRYLDSYTDEELNKGSNSIDLWLTEGENEDYNKIDENLNKLRSSLGVSELFVYKAKTDANGNIKNDFVILFDAPATGKVYALGEEFGKSAAFDMVNKVYETGEPQLEDSKSYSKTRFMLVAYAPIKDEAGKVSAIAGAQVSLSSVMASVFKDNWFMLLDEAIDFLLLGLALAFFIKKSIITPVDTLSKHMSDFVSDESGLEYTPINEIKTNDELEQMCDDFNALAERVVDYTKDIKEKTAEQEHIKADLNVASQIRSIISGKTIYPAFPERTDFDLCLSMQHTINNKCSFANYFFVDTNKLYIVIGEALGSNLASIIFSALSLSYIKSTAKMGLEPYRVAAEVNNNLCSIEKKDRGLTIGAVIAEIDLKEGIMRYVNAGMPPLLIKNPGESFTLDKASLPFSLGQMHGVAFRQNTLNLSQGSTVLFTSYGVSETVGSNGSDYSMQRLLKNVNDLTRDVYELDKIIYGVENDLDNFRGDTPLKNDTAILGFRYFG